MFGDTLFKNGRTWDPWRDFARLSDEMNRLLAGVADPTWQSPRTPAVNVWTGPEGAVLTSEVPGLDATSLEVTVQNQSLTVRGKRPEPELEGAATWHRRERSTGDFVRSIELPFRVDAAKVEARYSRGVLRVFAPRAEADKPRKISVKTE